MEEWCKLPAMFGFTSRLGAPLLSDMAPSSIHGVPAAYCRDALHGATGVLSIHLRTHTHAYAAGAYNAALSSTGTQASVHVQPLLHNRYVQLCNRGWMRDYTSIAILHCVVVLYVNMYTVYT